MLFGLTLIGRDRVAVRVAELRRTSGELVHCITL